MRNCKCFICHKEGCHSSKHRGYPGKRGGQGGRPPPQGEHPSWRKSMESTRELRTNPLVTDYMKQHGDLPREHHRASVELLLSHPSCQLERDSQRRIGRPDQLGFLERKKGSAPSLPKDTKSVLVTTSAQSITIPVMLYKMENGKIAETTALIDSGATICCIDLHFA